MRYKLFLIDESPAGVGGELFFQTDDLGHVAKLRATANSLVGSKMPATVKAGAKGRKVYVVDKSAESDSQLVVGDIFDTAAACSFALGYGYNAVSQQLCKASNRGEKQTELRGITVCYEDGVPGVDNVD